MNGPAGEVLVADGYRALFPIALTDDDFDGQGHLNNSVVARLFNDLRIGYIRTHVGERWTSFLRDQQVVVVARELHVSYESEGFPHETFVGAVRYTRREGKAAIMEHRIVDAATGRAVASGWVVQLLVKNGSVIDFPEWYYEIVARVEGRGIERRARPDRSFGP